MIFYCQKISIFKVIDKDDSDFVYQYVFDKDTIADAYIYLEKKNSIASSI